MKNAMEENQGIFMSTSKAKSIDFEDGIHVQKKWRK